MDNNDTSLESQEVLADIYRRMLPAENVRRIFSAYQTGRELCIAGLKLSHPQATEKQLWYLWARQHLGDNLFEEVYGAAKND